MRFTCGKAGGQLKIWKMVRKVFEPGRPRRVSLQTGSVPCRRLSITVKVSSSLVLMNLLAEYVIGAETGAGRNVESQERLPLPLACSACDQCLNQCIRK